MKAAHGLLSVRTLALAGVIVMTVGCDRVTKHLATTALSMSPAARSYFANTIHLQYAENQGGFLSLGAGLPAGARTGIFTIATGMLLAGLVAAAVRQRWQGWFLVGLSLVVAGGASNLADRIVSGTVVDFIVVGIGPLRTGVFNVADMAILFGGLLLVFAEIRAQRREVHSS